MQKYDIVEASYEVLQEENQEAFAMHTFQPYPIEMLEMNPFTKFSKEWGLVTAGTKEKYNTMTVSWGGMGVIWGKNTVTIYVRDSRYTKEFLDGGDFFSLSFLGEEYREALNICGSKSGRDCDKFKTANLTPAFRHGLPYPDEANLVIFCKTMAKYTLSEDGFQDADISKKFYGNHDMHCMYVAEVIEVMAR